MAMNPMDVSENPKSAAKRGVDLWPWAELNVPRIRNVNRLLVQELCLEFGLKQWEGSSSCQKPFYSYSLVQHCKPS